MFGYALNPHTHDVFVVREYYIHKTALAFATLSNFFRFFVFDSVVLFVDGRKMIDNKRRNEESENNRIGRSLHLFRMVLLRPLPLCSGGIHLYKLLLRYGSVAASQRERKGREGGSSTAKYFVFFFFTAIGNTQFSIFLFIIRIVVSSHY